MIIVNLSDIIFIHCNDVIIVHTLTHLLNGLLDNLLRIEKIIMNFILIYSLFFQRFSYILCQRESHNCQCLVLLALLPCELLPYCSIHTRKYFKEIH